MNTSNQIMINIGLILLFRFLDILSTKFLIIDFEIQELNLLAAYWGMQEDMFYLVEIFIAFAVVILYVYYERNRDVFKIVRNPLGLKEYIVLYLYGFMPKNLYEWNFKVSIKNSIVLIGSIVPMFVIISSTVYILNNLCSYFISISTNEHMLNLGDFLYDNYFYQVIAYVFPPTLLCYLLFSKLKEHFVIYNTLKA